MTESGKVEVFVVGPSLEITIAKPIKTKIQHGIFTVMIGRKIVTVAMGKPSILDRYTGFLTSDAANEFVHRQISQKQHSWAVYKENTTPICDINGVPYGESRLFYQLQH